jgi:DNA helicase-2/ATP-dependent DNA helicase PcrA
MASYLSSLNPQQAEAVAHFGGPLLILAGAGSGKTRVITVKIAHLIEELGVPPTSILAVTFTNKAAAEMRLRAAELSPRASDVMIRTFHSFGAWFLRRNAHLAGMPAGFTIYDDDDSVSLLRTLFPEQQRSHLNRVAHAIARCKDYCLSPEDDLSIATAEPQIDEYYRRYEARLREIGNADFGDLILRPIRILQEHPEVLNRTRDRFRAILVDEYQDSNIAQFELLKLLFGPGGYLCVVGDDDQSIYRFRGAEVRNILEFADSFPGTTTIRLEQNYRSTARILDVASEVVRLNRGRLGKTLWTDRAGGAPPILALLDDEEAEARYCLDLANAARKSQKTLAILYRTNAQSRTFETLFLRAGIPHQVVGTVRFYSREEVKDALAYLKFLANRDDEVSFRRLVGKPPRGIGPATFEKIVDYARTKECDLLQALEGAAGSLSTKQRTSARELSGFLSDILAGLGDGAAPAAAPEAPPEATTLSEIISRLVAASGLEDLYRDRDEDTSAARLENLEELVNAGALFPGSMEGLVEFLESIELDSLREEEAATDPFAATLITMHNTKGLEFDVVVVTGLEDGLFPRSGDELPEELEEERRLFYVSVTRAREGLYLTSCRSRRVHGRRLPLQPSRFIEEIPEDLITIDDQSSAASDQGDYPPGTAVYHDDYGSGMVIRQWRAGDQMMVLVQFESGRRAQFIPRYTSLERISGDF